ncbi:hypothetical protein M1349_03140 [Patescibacteria group bacterium]|nr:hypothetical protein [Patescibacteria group bacterium]
MKKENELSEHKTRKGKDINFFLVVALLLAVFMLGILTNQLMSSSKISTKTASVSQKKKGPDLAKIEKKVLPEKVIVKINWGSLGKRLTQDGVLDRTKLAQSLTRTNNLPKDVEKYLDGNEKQIELNQANAHFWLNVLWGFGLANKNKLLDSGDMQTASQNNPANFASTGGYTLGSTDPMSAYSKYSYVALTDKQQQIVEEISGNIYRPCCGNSAAFPDCNHGMAMLGLIELMVSQNRPKQEIYDTALAFNTLWFPQTYLDIAYHFEKANRDYAKIPSQQILSKTFSSSQGYAVIRKEVGALPWPSSKSGGSCGA